MPCFVLCCQISSVVVAGKLQAAYREPTDIHLQHRSHTARLLVLCFVLCHDKLMLLG